MSTTKTKVLEFKQVSFSSKGQTILENITFSIKQGEIVTVLGPNGAGKSTIAKLVLGLISPIKGHIQRNKNARIGYMPQKIHFEPTLPMSVAKFLSLLPLSPSTQAIKTTLKEVGAPNLMHQSLHQLSGGELQRVLLARSLLLSPDLLVLDEPAQGVDIAGQHELYGLINRINKERGCAVLLISHDLHLVMATTNQVLCINKHICCSGPPDTVSQDPAYLNLFGQDGKSQLAIYAHQHDHTHDLSGHMHPSEQEKRGE